MLPLQAQALNRKLSRIIIAHWMRHFTMYTLLYGNLHDRKITDVLRPRVRNEGRLMAKETMLADGGICGEIFRTRTGRTAPPLQVEGVIRNKASSTPFPFSPPIRRRQRGGVSLLCRTAGKKKEKKTQIMQRNSRT